MQDLFPALVKKRSITCISNIPLSLLTILPAFLSSSVIPRLNNTVHRRVSPTHKPRNHSGVRAYNMYQEHMHNCKRIPKPKWLGSIYYHHRWFISEMGAAEYI